MLRKQIWSPISKDFVWLSCQTSAQSHQRFTNPAQKDFKYWALLSSYSYHRSPKQHPHLLSNNCRMTEDGPSTKSYWTQVAFRVIRSSLIPPIKQVTLPGVCDEKVIHTTTFLFQLSAVSCTTLSQNVVLRSYKVRTTSLTITSKESAKKGRCKQTDFSTIFQESLLIKMDKSKVYSLRSLHQHEL